jgi:uncharacterized membrane protein
VSRAERTALAASLAAAVFLVSWGLIHHGFYARNGLIVDTGLYRDYGERMIHRDIPYRDFDVEYPPAALPVFLVPSFAPAGEYVRTFEWVMAALGVLAILCAASIRAGSSAFLALSPLLVGSILLSRFDLWPAALTVAALAALLAGLHRLGWAVLGIAVAAKLYPFVIVPPALAWAWRRGRLRAALAGAAAFAVVVGPFAVIAPGGLWRSVEQQLSRPLQIESLGAAFFKLHGDPTVETSHGSQNIVGHGGVATALVALQVIGLVAVWILAWRDPDDLTRHAAAAVATFVAFGKVFSPQFMIWLVPLVPLVRGRRGLIATGLLAAALILTQVWFAEHYWQYVDESKRAWAVLARDLTVVALAVVLAVPWPRRATAPARG